MYSGFDFGTSNCALGVFDNLSQVQLVPLEQKNSFIPSTLYSYERELICEFVAKRITEANPKQNYLDLRKSQVRQALRVRKDHDIREDEQSLFFGHEAFEQYIDLPSEGYFIKSPKSFLGASGLRNEFVQFFEDIVTAMMQNIKHRAEQHLKQEITQTVIGRPVNFQGLNAEKSNQQAIQILETSAKRAGFKNIEFLYEPIAAGLDFESDLQRNTKVLVVDIGGGTTDCAMVMMGPDYRNKNERKDDFLGHTGERVGGNDLDIQLAGRELMPVFGMMSQLKNGLPMPTQLFWDAVSTNDAGAQSNYNHPETERALRQLMLDTTEPKLLQRFIELRHKKQNYQIVRIAESTKIALSDTVQYTVKFDDLSPSLSQVEHIVSREKLTEAIERPLSKMIELMKEAVAQSGTKPELVYVTGGSAKSVILKEAIRSTFGEIETVDGDHFGSVASGLTIWANKIFL